MLLGLPTYSLHLHGMGQNWGGFKLQWEPVWDIFGLMDEAREVDEARRREYQAVVESIRFACEELGAGSKA